jgi:hypothetical protein
VDLNLFKEFENRKKAKEEEAKRVGIVGVENIVLSNAK